MSADAPASSSPPASDTPASPKTAPFLPTLGIEYPPDHPIARRASKLQAQKEAQQAAALAAASSSSSGSNITPIPSPTKAGEGFQAHLLEQFSTPLSVPSSPAEQARRMSITPASRRNSILAIPPIQEIPIATDHLPEPGSDAAVDLAEIEKEIEEIDTVG